MRKTLLILLLVFGFCQLLEAQSSRDHWYFGLREGLRFENNALVVDTRTQMSTHIGSVSISDQAGNLLFYSNGRAFYNRNHELMPSNQGSEDPVLIDVISLPSTTNPNIHFVYSVLQNWLTIYTVDMSLDGGLGDVVESDRIDIPKGISAVTALKNCENQGYWLFTVEHRNGESLAFNAWAVNGATGSIQLNSTITTPQVENPLIWEMTTSPLGNQIVVVSENDVYVLGFNTTCAKFTGLQKIPRTPFTSFPTGACYSPSGNHLYLSYVRNVVPALGYLYQIDPNNPLDPTPFNTTFSMPYVLYGMANGPDGYMYIATRDMRNGKMGIDRLEEPNRSPISLYQQRVVELNPNSFNSPFFPNFLVDDRNCSETQELPELEETVFCEGDSLYLKVKHGGDKDSIFLVDYTLDRYYMMKENAETVLSPLRTGTYSYDLLWSSCGVSGGRTIEIKIVPKPQVEVSDTTLCNGGTLKLKPVDSTTYRLVEIWQDSSFVVADATKGVMDPGRYRITLDNGSCFDRGQFSLSLINPLLTDLPASSVFCEKAGSTVQLDAGVGFLSYKWHPTNDTTQWIIVKSAGDYLVVVKDSRGCMSGDGTNVKSDCGPSIYVPNAFSPNGDGLNDWFSPVGRHLSIENVKIYDRWGAIVHFAENESFQWDGSKNGETLPLGVYYYLIRYRDKFDKHEVSTLMGKVHLIR